MGACTYRASPGWLPHLDADNIGTVTARAAHMSKREIDELVAELSPTQAAGSIGRKLQR